MTYDFTPSPLPLTIKALSSLARQWPLPRGHGKLTSIMRFFARNLRGYFLANITIGTRKVPIALPFPDDASFSIALFGEQDLYLFQLLSELCQRCPTHRENYFVDIGANLGVYALRIPLTSPVKTIAFEPQSELSELLLFNSRALGLLDRMAVHNVAVGESAGRAHLTHCENDRGKTQVRADLNADSASALITAIETLDALLSGIDGTAIAAIKLDAEGFEPQILRGGHTLLSQHQPPIVVELNRLEHPTSAQEILPLLSAHGYSEFFVVDRKIYPLVNGALPICNVLALSKASQVLKWLQVDPNFTPASSAHWPLSAVE